MATTNTQSCTNIHEIAAGIYRINTPMMLPGDVAFSFNQYLIDDDEPLLFHTGLRQLFPLVNEAVASVLPAARLRHIAFSHVEADECGALNLWLAAAPQSAPLCGTVAAMVSVNDLADRAPRALADGEVLNLGHHRVRWFDAPHLPHGWDCGFLMEETTGTLLCGDLFTQPGRGQVAGQAVAEVDRGAGQATQRQAGLHARRRAVQAVTQLGRSRAALAPLRQAAGGVAQGAGDPDVLARARAAAQQGLPGRHQAVGGDRHRQRAARGVAADQRDTVLPGQIEEAIEEALYPRRIGLRQRQRQGAPRRLRPHRSEVGEIHRQRLPADVRRRCAAREVDAVVQRICGDDELPPRRWRQQRGVVADAQHHVVAAPGAGADAVDQGELARHQDRRGACASAVRQSAAAWSSTPLTKVWPCSEPKRLVVSMASLMITR